MEISAHVTKKEPADNVETSFDNALLREIGIIGVVENIVSGLAVNADVKLFVSDLEKGCVIKLEEK